MSKYTAFFMIGTLWLLILGVIVEPFPNVFVLFNSFAIGVFTTMAGVMLYMDKHGK